MLPVYPWLRRATLLFLALPLLIFLGGFLRGPLAVVTCAVIGAGLWRMWSGAKGEAAVERDTRKISGRVLAAVAMLAAVLTGLSGAGGWGSGDSDWLKHDTILRDLLVRPWPVAYETGQGPVLLVYYTAFYLPAALVGKLAGGSWTVASQALALTTFLGIVLAGGWLIVLGTDGAGTRRRGAGWIAAAVFFGFSGLDVLGKMSVNAYYGLAWFYGNWYDIEWWAQFAQYSSNAATLFWAPQHAFGGWLPLALVLDDWFGERPLERRAVLYLALALFWSPFAAVGLLPILGALGLWRWRAARWRWEWWRGMVTWPNAAGAVAGAVFALYLLAHFQSFPLPEQYKVAPGFLPMPLLEIDHASWAAVYLGFVLVEFAGLSAATAWFFAGRRDEEARRAWPLWWVVTGVLLLLPCFRYGYANDLVMRGAIPALFALQVLLVRMLAVGGGGKRGAVVLAVVLLAGGLGNVGVEYARHVERIRRQGSWRDARTREPVQSLADLARTIYARPGFDFTRQYLGSADSVFARRLAARRGMLAPGAKPGEADF